MKQYIYKEIPHPCKTCLVFAICQTRLQDSIRTSVLTYAGDYYYDDDNESSHADYIMSSFHLTIGDCPMLQEYISKVTKQLNPPTYKYSVDRQGVTIDALYNAFNISVSHLLKDILNK